MAQLPTTVDIIAHLDGEELARAIYLLSFGVTSFYSTEFMLGLWEKAKSEHVQGRDSPYLMAMAKANRFLTLYMQAKAIDAEKLEASSS